jgi:hypothetical protein
MSTICHYYLEGVLAQTRATPTTNCPVEPTCVGLEAATTDRRNAKAFSRRPLSMVGSVGVRVDEIDDIANVSSQIVRVEPSKRTRSAEIANHRPGFQFGSLVPSSSM